MQATSIGPPLEWDRCGAVSSRNDIADLLELRGQPRHRSLPLTAPRRGHARPDRMCLDQSAACQSNKIRRSFSISKVSL